MSKMTEQEQVQLVTEGKNNEVLTTSKIVAHEFGKQHRNVMRDIRAFKKDVLNFEQMFYEDETKDSYGRKQKIFDMTRDGFSLLAMGFTGKKALQFKLKFINEFNKMEEYIKTQQQLANAPSYQIEDPVARAKKWIEEQEYTQSLETTLEEEKPEVQYARDLAVSDHSTLVGTFATILSQNGVKIGQNRLFKYFRDEHYLMSVSGEDRHNLPTQKSLDAGLFEVKTSVKYDWKAVGYKTYYTALVTVKGQKYFLNKFLHDNK